MKHPSWPLRPGDRIRARVTATSDHGLNLRGDGVEVLVHVTDAAWYRVIHPADYAKIGDELEVTILRVTDDGKIASGWLPWPEWHPTGQREAIERRLRTVSG